MIGCVVELVRLCDVPLIASVETEPVFCAVHCSHVDVLVESPRT